MVQLGVSLPQFQHFNLQSDVVTAARDLEAIGFDSLWVFERILVPADSSGVHGLYGVPDLPWLDAYRSVPDPLITLALAAAVTERIKLGTGVLVAGLHLPMRLARTLATLDAASGGRLIAGLGSGWSIDEFAASSPRPIAERGKALDEFLDIAEAVWGPDPVSFSNDRYTIEPAVVGPKPAGRIPVLLAAGSDKALDRIARRADGWLPTSIPPTQVASTMARLREMAAGYGRDPGALSCTFQIVVSSLTPVPTVDRQPYTGSVEQVVEDIATLAEAGADQIYVTVPMAVRDVKELIAVSADLHSQVRAAGL